MTHLAPTSDQLTWDTLASVLTMPKALVTTAALTAWRRQQGAGWELALLLHRIGTDGLAGEHETATAWARAHLGFSSSLVAKYRGAAAALLKANARDRAAYLNLGPVTFYEAGFPKLRERAPQRVVKLCESGRTQRELRQAAALTVCSTAARGWRRPPLVKLLAIEDGMRWGVSAIRRGAAGVLVSVDLSAKGIAAHADVTADELVTDLVELATVLGVRAPLLRALQTEKAT